MGRKTRDQDQLDTMTHPLVELRGLRKVYGDAVAVESVELSIESGEFVVLLGPSGSGKTTILSMIGGFTEPDAGSVLIDGQDVTALAPAKRPTVTVFQDYALFPHMSVAGNVGFGLEMRRVSRAPRAKRVAEALELVGLTGYGTRSIHQLSGGQRQRVALARAIAVEPTVLLLDEPLGALDLNLRRQMQEELVGLQKQLGTTFVHVTHDQDEAMSIADKIVVMNAGKIEDQGSPDRVYLKPATLFTATFMGESNILKGVVEHSANGEVQVSTPLVAVSIPGTVPVGSKVSLSIRPEQLRLEASENTVSLGRARLKDMVFQGAHWRSHATPVKHPEIDLLLRIPVERAAREGDELEFFVRREDVVLLQD